MARVKTKPKSRYPAIVKENGLQEQWKSGRLEIVEEQGQDNPKKTVERLRVKEAYTSLKMITDVQKNCALRYALLVEKAEGATQDVLASANICSVGGNKWEPTHAQITAYEDILKIKAIVGNYHISILDLIILQNKDCKQVAQIKGFNQYYAAGMVMSAFIKLEEACEELDGK